MATLQKFIKVGSSIAAVIPKRLIGVRGAGAPISVERGKHPDMFIVRVLTRKAMRLNARENRVLSITDAFINRYHADLKRLKDA
ncbi:MAG TPA: hypothetical protein VJ043_01520 [Candidatus Paceibacterota bacterium]|nr:hypothetical protein [Candidatus Paceibacterota bacterium]